VIRNVKNQLLAADKRRFLYTKNRKTKLPPMDADKTELHSIVWVFRLRSTAADFSALSGVSDSRFTFYGSDRRISASIGG